MTDPSKLGPWVRRFLLEHLVGERNLACSTQRSYRDALVLLIPFIAAEAGKQVDQLAVEHVSAERVQRFLQDLEQTRGCSVTTRNQRLAVLHALARFIGQHSPEHIEWCGQIRAIPFKRATKAQLTYLEKWEMDALLAAPNHTTALGRRDYALLLFLYNTGARADEAAQLKIGDFDLARVPRTQLSSVQLHGKGGKVRRCPLWSHTVDALGELIQGRPAGEHVFLNRCRQPITRFGIHTMVERHVRRALARAPSLASKQVSPHTIRHTTATHLLRAGVDINTIRAWLGHVSLDTTTIYAETDLEMKAKALAHCELTEPGEPRRWREDAGLMAFLRSL